uniref:Ig-like domain-containing protein n=1 Tax=Pygocentrus nattereri TaxID=42514 RepID=A0AAR2L7S2_PYGNA
MLVKNSNWCVSAGCTLKNGGNKKIIAHKHGSVLLPCQCIDPHSSPDRLTWEKFMPPPYRWKMISSESGQYRNRVQLFNDHSPGNLSLLISHLTEEDTGFYRCNVKQREKSFILLTVEEAPATKLTPTLSRNIQTSVEPTATISSQTGCTLEDSRQTKQITAYTQESVLLPCYCTDPRTTPERLIWKKLNPNTREWEDISSGSGQYRSRVQLVNGHSPGNLSLLISHLIEEDGGDYRCDVKQNEYILIRLTVKGNSPLTNARAEPPQSLPFVPFGLVTVIILHIIVAVVYHTKRNKVLETARIYYNSADEAVSL